MLPLVTNAPMDSAPGATRTPATVLPLSTTVINTADAPNAIRTLTEQAVTASPLVRQATGEAANSKPSLRSISTTGSSQLAAQWIAQIPDASADDLQLFAPTMSAPAPSADGKDAVTYAALKPATGEQPQAQAPTQPSTPTEIAARILATPAAQSLAAAETAPRMMARDGAPSSNLSTPPVKVSVGNKRENVTQVRGADAYALSGARNERAEATVSEML